jgi:PhnB protein
MPVKKKPDGYASVTPYLIVAGAAQAIDWYRDAFGAVERTRMEAGEGKLGHAELQVGDSVVMLADEYPDMGFKGPVAYGGSPVSMLLYVDDVDASWAKAVGMGAEVVRPLADQFYGDRTGTLKDPFGHQWTLATHVEDVSDEEIGRRYQAMMEGCAEG